MRALFVLALASLCLSTPLGAASLDELKEHARRVAGAGAAAAGFAQVAKGNADAGELERRFLPFGEEAYRAATRWTRDRELLDAPPAFRRFLYFEYLTSNTGITAAASNPDQLLINRDSAVGSIFEEPALVDAARRHMESGTEEAQFEVVGQQLLATFPMVPPPDKAAACMACHASREVNRPYPPAARILGYTFVVQSLDPR